MYQFCPYKSPHAGAIVGQVVKWGVKYECIRKYGSTSYVGIGQVKNGRLYFRYGSSSEKTTAN